MKAFLAEIIPKIQKFTKKLDELTLLLDHHWVLLDQSSTVKRIYIFRQQNELLISANGKVEKSKWDYLGNKSLLLENSEGSFLFKIGFFDENVLALTLDNTDGYIFLVNETRASKDLNTIESIIDFLSGSYLGPSDGKEDNNLPSEVKILTTGQRIEFQNYPHGIKGNKVTIDGQTPGNCIVTLQDKDLRYEIKNGEVFAEYYIVKYNQDDGSILELDGSTMNGIAKGSRAWINGSPAPNGTYKRGYFSKVIINNGLVI